MKVLEIKSDGVLHKVTYHILYSLRAQVAKYAVDLYLVLVDFVLNFYRCVYQFNLTFSVAVYLYLFCLLEQSRVI